MARRSTSQSKIDDGTFPVRIRIVVPDTGFGTRIDAMLEWLHRLPDRTYAWHGGATGGSAWSVRHATNLYFRAIDDAQGFLTAFPDVELCDDVPT